MYTPLLSAYGYHCASALPPEVADPSLASCDVVHCSVLRLTTHVRTATTPTSSSYANTLCTNLDNLSLGEMAAMERQWENGADPSFVRPPGPECRALLQLTLTLTHA